MTTAIEILQPSNLTKVSVQINGNEPAPFHLDTGASTTIISEDYAQELNLALSADFKDGHDASGVKHNMQLSEKLSLTLDGKTVTDTQVATAKFATKFYNMQNEVKGTLGFNFMKNYTIKINYQSKQMEVSDQRLNQPNAVPFQFIREHIIGLKGEINGNPCIFIFDTGATHTVLNSDFLTFIDLPLFESTVAVHSPTKRLTAFNTQVQNLKTEFFIKNDFSSIAIPLDHLLENTNEKLGGVLGFDTFREKIVEIDYVSQKILIHS